MSELYVTATDGIPWQEKLRCLLGVYIINYAGSVHNLLEVYITAISPKGSVQSSNGYNQFFNGTLTNKNGLVSTLVFYAQSTSAIISGRLRTA